MVYNPHFCGNMIKKFSQIWIFGSKTNHLATLLSTDDTREKTTTREAG
jgi:hypothetical protein